MRERGHEVAFHCVEHVRHDAMTRREIEIDIDSGLMAERIESGEPFSR
jgi:peptidoglycan/xylan/chitin deacetylase (PgdA/CDA1 family)